MLKRAASLLQSAEDNSGNSWDDLMIPMAQIDLLYEYGWSPVEHLLSVVNTEEMRQAHESVLPAVVQFGLQIGQSRPVYDKMCGLRDGSTWNEIPACRQRIITRAIHNAELSGIGLKDTEQEIFNKNQQIMYENTVLGDYTTHDFCPLPPLVNTFSGCFPQRNFVSAVSHIFIDSAGRPADFWCSRARGAPVFVGHFA